jgi:stress response protein YsnF
MPTPSTSRPSGEIHEVVLHEERLVIEKRVVPTERVRMRKETITEDQAVSGEVRTEQVVFSEVIQTGGTAPRPGEARCERSGR